MSSGFDTTHPRFLRPIDVARLRRNQNRIHVQRVLDIIRNVVLLAVVVVIALAIYRHTQSDARFAVRSIEIAGATHTPKAELEAVTSQYIGTNLFKIDIDRVQRDMRSLAWVNRVEIEKKLPGTLLMRIVERTPVALLQQNGELRYVDENGVAFAILDPAVGDPDLPLIVADCPAPRIRRIGPCEEVARAVALIRDLQRRDPQVFSRLSEVRPIVPSGFALYDRDLGATVYANSSDVSDKFRSLYAIVQAEGLTRGSVAYADLRFADRVVIKPRVVASEAPRVEEAISTQPEPEPVTLLN